MELIKLNARGTIIQVDKSILIKSNVLSVWFTSIMKQNDEDYILNFSPKKVHMLIDYLNDQIVDIEKIRDIADYLQISLDNELMTNMYENLKEENAKLLHKIKILEKDNDKNSLFNTIKISLIVGFERNPRLFLTFITYWLSISSLIFIFILYLGKIVYRY